MVGPVLLGRTGCRDLRSLLPRGTPEGYPVNAVETVGLVLVIALGAYLFVALLKPEKFQ